ncbi:hypothetical protein BC830DRAFT_875653 [Chytriomyces sp. MP71]|nr:hypothetical protein BC830DRAFT_875653 [Chytriomyces sp. MP71]
MGSRHSTAGGSRDDSGYVGGGGDEEMGSLGRGRDQQTVKLSHNAYQQPYLHQQHQHQQVRKKVSSESMRRNAELLESSMTSNARKNGLHKSVRRTSTSLGDEWDEALQLLERLDSFKDDPISVHPTLKDMISKSPKLSRMASFKADMTVVAAEDVIPAVNRPTLPKQVNEAVPRHQLEKRASQSDFFFLPASERSITAPTTDSNDALSYPTAFTPSASFSPDRAHVPSNQTQVGKMVSQSEMASPPKSPKRHASVQAFPDDKTPVASPGRKSLASSRSEPDMRNQPPGSDEELDVAPVRCVTPKSSKGSLKAGSVKTSTPDYSGEGLKPRSSNASLTSTSADGVAKGSRTVTPRSSDTSLAVTKVTGTSAPKQDKSVKLRSSTISLNSISANYPANANLAPPRRKNLKPKLSDTSIRVTYTQQNDAATESTTMSSIVPILEYAEGTITPSLTAAHPTLRTRSEHLKADRASRRSSAFVTSLRETTERILKDTGVLEVGGGSVSAGLGVEDAVSARSVLKNQLKSLLDTEMVRKVCLVMFIL